MKPGEQTALRALVADLAAARVTPDQLARVRRRVGLDASPLQVARAVRPVRSQRPLDGLAATVADPEPVLVAGVDMPEPLTHIWSEGGPLWLWHRGIPPSGPAVAIVGTRRPTADGLALAAGVASDLADAGVMVVSGMARGIDQAAHRGALAAGGVTTAVLGTGLGVEYPAGSGPLMEQVASSGSVLTEYPPGHGIRQPSQFLARNRILVGLARAVVVVEAGRRSGALNSATWAASFGRDVLVVPASPSNRSAAGSLALLVDGATPVRDAADVLDAIGLARPDAEDAGVHEHPVRHACLHDTDVAQVFGLLGPTEASPSDLVRASGLSVREVLVAVSRLEDAGLVDQGPSGVVRR